MAYEGGTFTTIPSSNLPGARINVVSRERATALVSERGILAIPIELNWGADDSIRSFKASDWTRDALYKFGYNTDAPEVKNIREMFLGGANELVVARLNGKGDKATNGIATAKYPGTRGNDLEVSIQADVDAGTVENELSNASVNFSANANQVTVKYSNLPEGYKPKASVTKDGKEIKNLSFNESADNITIYVTPEIRDGEFNVLAYAAKDTSKILLSTGTLNATVTPATTSTIKLKEGSASDNYGETGITVSYEVTDNTVKATLTGAEEYTITPELKQGAATLNPQAGKLTLDQQDGSITYTFLSGLAENQNYSLTIKAKKTAEEEVEQEISVYSFSTQKEGEDKEASVAVTYSSAETETLSPTIPAKFVVKTFLDGAEVDKQTVKNVGNLKDNDFIVWNRSIQLEENAGVPLTGGSNSEVTVGDYSEALNKLETQVFHVLALPVKNESIQQMFIEYTKRLRDTIGIKFQTVMPPTEEPANYEGIIQVSNTLKDDDVNPDTDLVYWTAGLHAGCRVQDSTANREYTGAYDIDIDNTQRGLSTLVDEGYYAFHLCRGIDRQQHVKTLLDINTLTEFGEGQNEDWTRNQTIRTVDQCCNDIAAIFNNNYNGIIPNTDAGRAALRTEIKEYLEELENMGAIQDFDASTISIEQIDKRIVKVEVEITPVNAMEQMYMTIYIL